MGDRQWAMGDGRWAQQFGLDRSGNDRAAQRSTRHVYVHRMIYALEQKTSIVVAARSAWGEGREGRVGGGWRYVCVLNQTGRHMGGGLWCGAESLLWRCRWVDLNE